MLILAGVSLNATIGDNGIITRAQQTNIAQGRAVLEEYLNQYYVEHYEELKDSENKAVSLITFPETSGYFYKPDLGALNYVVDSEGHALYLINKSGLPKEIKDGLVGGDAGNGEYADYQSLNDVYGVTSNLKVYYCSNGLDSITGLAKEELDIDNPTRVVFPAGSALAELITGSSDKEITAQDVKQITELEVDGKKVSNLSDLYNLTSLKTLILKDYNGSMEGVENATQINKIQLENCVISDYSSIGKLGKKLNKLYLYDVDDNEVTKLCDKTIGIADYELENLNYFGVVGNKTSLDYDGTNINSKVASEEKSLKRIKDTTKFDNLKTKTKEAVKYLYVNNNEIADLSGFKNYKSVLALRGEYNSLTTLIGLENMQVLSYLIVNNNELGVNETETKNENTDSLIQLVGKNKLSYLNLQTNKIIHISYIGKLNSLSYLYLAGNSKFALAEIPNIAEIYNRIVGGNKNIDNVYLDYLTTSETLIYKNLASKDVDKINYLKNLPQEQKDKVKFINLNGSTIEDSIFNEILYGYNNLVELDCTSCSKLATLNWMKGKTQLKQFLFENTAIAGDEVENLDNYATALVSFKCNNININLNKMPKTISNAFVYYSQYTSGNNCAVGITNGELSNKLETCTEMTYLCTYGCTSPSDGILDLTNTKLKDGYFQSVDTIVLPSSITKISSFYFSTKLDFKNLTNKSFDSFYLGHSGRYSENLKWELNNITTYNVHFNTLSLDIRQNEFIDFDLLSYLNNVNADSINFGGLATQENFKFVPESWTGTLLNLKSITMTGTTLNNLDFLQNNMLLESVSLTNCKIADISGLKCYNTLKNLVLSNNNITNLDGISNFTHLGENVNGTAGILNLSSNPIYDTYNYPSVDGVSKKVQNIEELAKLKQSARSLNTIILLPNDYIIDYGPLERLGYNKNTGKF